MRFLLLSLCFPILVIYLILNLCYILILLHSLKFPFWIAVHECDLLSPISVKRQLKDPSWVYSISEHACALKEYLVIASLLHYRWQRVLLVDLHLEGTQFSLPLQASRVGRWHGSTHSWVAQCLDPIFMLQPIKLWPLCIFLNCCLCLVYSGVIEAAHLFVLSRLTSTISSECSSVYMGTFRIQGPDFTFEGKGYQGKLSLKREWILILKVCIIQNLHIYLPWSTPLFDFFKNVFLWDWKSTVSVECW